MNLSHTYRLARRYMTLNNGVLVAAVLIVLASVWNTVETLQKNYRLQQKVDLLNQEVQVTELEKDTLKLQQQYLKSSEYLELTARAKLGKALPGEHVIILPPIPKKASTVDQTALLQSKKVQSNFDKWMRFFFGR